MDGRLISSTCVSTNMLGGFAWIDQLVPFWDSPDPKASLILTAAPGGNTTTKTTAGEKGTLLPERNPGDRVLWFLAWLLQPLYGTVQRVVHPLQSDPGRVCFETLKSFADQPAAGLNFELHG